MVGAAETVGPVVGAAEVEGAAEIVGKSGTGRSPPPPPPAEGVLGLEPEVGTGTGATVGAEEMDGAIEGALDVVGEADADGAAEGDLDDVGDADNEGALEGASVAGQV